MTSSENIITKKLKIKFGCRTIDDVHGSRPCEFVEQSSLTNERGYTASLDKKCHFQTGKPQNLKQKPTISGANKRGPSGAIEGQQEKRQKLDRSATHQCSVLLRTLMRHPAGWVFNQPVDPIKLNIPDYFSVISSPMDFGTIKTKLEKNMYVGTEEFATDVRLTFSNAKLYNPPTNDVHKMAEELRKTFETKWKSLEERWNCEGLKSMTGKLMSGRTPEITDARHNCPKTPPQHNAVLQKRSKSSEQKDARTVIVKLTKPAGNCMQKLSEKNFLEGTGNGGRHTSGSVNVKPSVQVACKHDTCSGSECQCNLPSDSTYASSDISSERSLSRDHHACSTDTSKLDCQAKSIASSQMSKSDPDSDGAVSAVDDENACPSSQPSSHPSSQLITPGTEATSEEGWRPIFDVPLSPSKALRAAMLKHRFADIILKSQHKTLADHGEMADPVKVQQEKERLERRQTEEKARIEAQIRAAEAASRMRKEIELKKQREREREAARVALQKMERTVEIEQNQEVIKELEMLSGCSLTKDEGIEVGKGEMGGQVVSSLEQLGLFIKDDVEDEDEILNGDGEEGEIFS